jgi:hypothetical protein
LPWRKFLSDEPDGAGGEHVLSIGLRSSPSGIPSGIDEQPAVSRRDDEVDDAGPARIGQMAQNFGTNEAGGVEERPSMASNLQAGSREGSLQSISDQFGEAKESHLTVINGAMSEGDEFVKIRIGTTEVPPIEIMVPRFLSRREMESIFVLKLNVRQNCRWLGGDTINLRGGRRAS